MTPNFSGKPIELTCSEQAFSEFPELLFGTSSDYGTFFDATSYIQTTTPGLDLANFFADFRVQIGLICKSNHIDADGIAKLNQQGHVLIEINFLYLFISFVKPDFLAYICDRIHELFMTGYCVSETQIARLAKYRLSKEVLIDLAANDGEL